MNEIPVTILKQWDDISITKKHIFVIWGVSIWTAMSQIEWDMIMDTPRELVKEVLTWYAESELTP